MDNTPLPHKLQVEPVGRCNLKCPMCVAPYREVSDRAALLDPGLFRELVSSLPRLEELHLQGIGEPLLHPRFFDLVRHAVDLGVRVTTSTNLTVLSDEMAEECVRSELDTVHVSIDAASSDLYGRIRVGARLKRVLSNIDRLTSARRRLRSSRPRLKLVTVLMVSNLVELPAIVELAGSRGFEAVFVQGLSHRFQEPHLPPRYLPVKEFVARESLSRVDAATVDRALDAAEARASDLGLELRLPRRHPRSEYADSGAAPRCDWPWTQGYVCFDGSVLPCCMVSTPDRVCVGSARDASLAEVWNGPGYTEFRRQLASNDPPEICRSCELYQGVF